MHHDAALFFGGDPVENADESYRRFFADVQMYATDSGIDPQQYLFSLLCDHIQTRENNWADGNNARSCNSGYDEAYAGFAETRNDPERAELVKRLNDLHSAELLRDTAGEPWLGGLRAPEHAEERPHQRLGQRALEHRRVASLTLRH